MRLNRVFRSVVAGTALCCAVAPLCADNDPYAAARREFQAAYAQPETRGADSAALQAYPLYPYLQAARLQHDLGTAAPGAVDTAVAGFLKQYGEQPVTRSLRRAWLPDLARRKAWAAFYAAYTDAVADTALRCDLLQARLALNLGKDLAPAVTEQWLNGRDTPPECEPAFDWLRAQQLLAPSLVDRRARLALAAGNARLARTLSAGLPPELAAPLRQWAALIEQPQREIDHLIAQPELPVEPAALQDGWMRLARADVDEALQRFQPLLDARKLDAAGASPYARALALSLAWSRRPEALPYFARVQPADVDERTGEWAVRAALWAGDWSRAAQAVAALPPALGELPRWRYWAARTAELQGDAAAAKAAYTQLSAKDNYYAALAAARLKQPYAPHPQPLPFDDAAAAQLAQQPALVRAHELFLCDLRPLAAVEWQAALDALEPASRVQAAGLALRWGWYEQGIASASKQGIFNDYERLYPRPYDAAVHAGAALAQLPEDLVYALLRQESLYDAQALSRAGAIGLLQLLPDTAQRTARRWQRPPPSRAGLFDPAINVPLGSAELRDLLNLFGNQLPPAIAAYNAGPNAATRWLPDTPRDAAVWIENIPYNETRDYVQRVLWHSVVFGWRRSGEPQKLDSWLGQVSMPAAPAPGSMPGPAP
ncbi:MAG: transglycosylase SLT domain-containing protein [Nevskia sp.]|nr:transglycosylase SLT domain-containing protein [Nevskia sp.]